MLGAYLAMPLLVAQFAPAIGAEYGFTETEVQIERPGADALSVPLVRLTAPGYQILSRNVRVSYTLGGLLRGGLDSVLLKELEVELQRDSESSAVPDYSPDLFFPLLPIKDIQVERLTIDANDFGFSMTGSANWSAEELYLNLQGSEHDLTSVFAVDVHVKRGGQVSLTLREDAGETTLRAAGHVAEDWLNLSGDFGVRAHTLATIFTEIPRGAGWLEGSYQAVIPWPVNPQTAWQEIEASAERTALNWSSADEGLSLDLTIPSVEINDGILNLRLNGIANVTQENVSGRLTFPEGSSLRYQKGQLMSRAGPHLGIEVGDIKTDATLGNLSMSMSPSISLEFEASVTIHSPLVGLQGVANGLISPEQGELGFSGKADLGDYTQPLDVTASYRLDESDLNATGELSTGQLKDVGFSINQNLESSAGSFGLVHKLVIDQPLAASLVAGWDEAYDMDAGTIDVTINASWSSFDQISTQATFALSRVAATYDDYRATDIDGLLELSTENQAEAEWHLASTEIHAGTIDVGLPVKDVRILVSAKGNRLYIESAHAELLSGTIQAAPFVYKLDTGSAEVALSAQSIDLADILALEGEDVSGTGRLNGSFPLTVIDNQVSMEKGHVRSIEPGGVILLNPELTRATGQPGLDFALEALQDFRYTELVGDIDYAQNGDMRLAIKLTGNNPAIEDGRTIEYNLNITENLPTLLRSLQLQDEVRAQVERKLNE